jgi:TP901 family phage tail tape measure protein
MMANVMSSLIVSLIDRVTGPAKAVANSVKGISQAAAAASNGGLAKVAEANAAALGRMRASMLEAVAAAYVLKEALSAPLSAASRFETILLDIAQKSDLSNDAMKAMGDRIRGIAPLVNKTAQEVASGIDVLTSMGLDPARALAIAPMLGKAASAYRSEMSDVATMTYAAIDNLKVPVADTMKMLDALSQASKEGAVEFRDMAKEFPTMSAIASKVGEVGLTGAVRLGAALQVVRKGFATGSEAATGLRDVLMKATSDEAVKRFKAGGIDIVKTLEETRKKGGDIMEALAHATMSSKTVNGDISKVGNIWTDVQAQIAMTSFIKNWAEYRRIRKAASEADGTVDKDYERRMKAFEARMSAFMIKINDLAITIGGILMPNVNDLADGLSKVVARVTAFAQANPLLIGRAIAATSAVIGLSVAARAAAWSFLFLKGGVLMIVAPLLKAAVAMGTFTASMATAAYAGVIAGLARLRAGVLSLMVLGAVGGPAAVFRALGAALMGLLSPIGLVAGAMKLLKLAVISTGIGAVLVAIAMAGLWIYENWAGLGAFFKSFGAAFMSALGPLASAVTPLIDTVKRLWDTVAGFFGEISPETWTRWGTAAGTAVGNLALTILELPGRIAGLGETLFTTGGEWMARLYDGALSGLQGVTTLIASIPRQFMELGGPTGEALYNAGVTGMRRFWDGLREVWTSIVGWVKGEVANIAESFASTFSFLPWAPKKTAPPAPSNDNAPAAATSPRLKRAGPRVIDNPDQLAPSAPGAEDLNGTIGPSADLSGVRSARQEVAALKKEIAEVNSTPIRIGASVAGGGGVARALRSEFNDAGM